MNERLSALERVEGTVAALGTRVMKLERALEVRLAADADDLAAQREAQGLGFGVEVLMLPEAWSEKQAVARRLVGEGWSAARIARVLRVCERTIERWAKKF